MTDLIISICIPCFNVEKYVSRCLDSILMQSYCNIEIICVDDGSSDNTYSILRDYSLKYKFIKVVRHIYNHQLLMARKTATLLASGQYIMFVDPDDVLENNTLTKLTDIIQAHNECEVIEFSASAWNLEENPPRLVKRIFVEGSKGSLCSTDIFLKLMRNEIGCTIWNKIYKTQVVRQVYSFLRIENLYSREDIYFCSVLYSVIKSYYGIDDILYRYSVGTGTSTKKISSLSQFKEVCKAGDIIYSLIEIYYDYLMFDKNKSEYLISKIKNWMCKKSVDFISVFSGKNEMSEAVRFFVLKWIDVNKLKLLVNLNNPLIFRLCECIAMCLFHALNDIRKFYPQVIFDPVVNKVIYDLSKIENLINSINSKALDVFLKKNISILGSCVCRDIFNVVNSKFNVLHYSNGISPFSLVSVKPDIILSEEDFTHRSHFEKKSCCIDWNKSYVDFYMSDGCSPEILIIDLNDARINVGKSVSSSSVFDFYFTLSTTFKENFLYNKINNKLSNFEYTVIDPLVISDSDWNLCIKNYCKFVTDCIKPSKLIVVETLCAEKWLDRCFINTFDNIDYIRKLNTLYRKLYDYLYLYLSIDFQVIKLPEDLVADKNHHLGLYPTHYTKDIYEYMHAQIEKIVFKS